MRPAITLITRLGLIGANRTFFTVTDRAEIARGYSKLNQEVPRRSGAPIAETKIVLSRPALIAVAFDHNLERRVLLENLPERSCALGHGRLRVGAQVALVVIEQCVQQVASPYLFVKDIFAAAPRDRWSRDRRRRRGRYRYGHRPSVIPTRTPGG